jgi:ABC-2 type transport system ATP-binding protein
MLDRAARVLTAAGDGPPTIAADELRITVPVSGGGAVLAEVVRQLDAAGVVIADLAVRRPTLDDVFLQLTGHAAETAATDVVAAAPTGSKR